tara:strand:- start:14 stop:1120 length:1107 start_codon:yes stop_codon:yes gene_type:complete
MADRDVPWTTPRSRVLIKKSLILNSDSRDRTKYLSPFHWMQELPTHYDNVVSIELEAMRLPVTNTAPLHLKVEQLPRRFDSNKTDDVESLFIVSDWNVGSVSNTAIFDPPIARMSKWTTKIERPAEYAGSKFSDVLDLLPVNQPYSYSKSGGNVVTTNHGLNVNDVITLDGTNVTVDAIVDSNTFTPSAVVNDSGGWHRTTASAYNINLDSYTMSSSNVITIAGHDIEAGQDLILIDDSDNVIATSVTNVSGDNLTINGTVAGEGKFYKLVFADKKITFKVDARIFSTLSVKQPLEINGTTTYNGEILSKDSSDNSITVLFPSTMTDYNLKNYNFTIFGNPIFSRQVKISLMISYLSDQVRQLRSDLL